MGEGGSYHIIPVRYSCNLLLRPHTCTREFKRDDTLIINQFVEAVEHGQWVSRVVFFEICNWELCN